MVRTYKRKTDRANISEEEMRGALRNIFSKNMSQREAARVFNLKRQTLQSRIKKILSTMTQEEYLQKYDDDGYESENTEKGKYATRIVFSMTQENMLQEYLKQCSNMNYGLTYAQLRNFVYDYAKALPGCKYPPSWDVNGKAGVDWLKGFMNRHPALSLRKPESTSLARGLGFNKTKVQDFFDNYKYVLEKYKFSPDKIFNLDETGVTTVLNPPKIVAQKGKKQIGCVTSAERGELVTFVGIISASGNSLPPVYVFPRIRNIEEYLSDAPPLSLALGNKSGWMTKELFSKTLEHVVRHTRCSKENKILLLLDNHESHTTLDAILYSRENGIVMLSFPPHTSHKLQPLDVGVYSPFKSKCSVAMNEWMISNPGKTVTIRQIPKITKQPFLEAFSPKNITSAFEMPGIWPVNSQSFTEVDFDSCKVYVDQPIEKTIFETDLDINQPSTSKGASEPNSSAFEKKIVLDVPKNKNLTPELVRPFPKVEKHQENKRKLKVNQGKSRIYTETPEKQRLEEIENDRITKEKIKSAKQEDKLKRKISQHSLNTNDKLKKARTEKVKRKIIDESSSSESEKDINFSDSSDDAESFESLQENDEVNPADYVLVKFMVKTSMIYYVGHVIDRKVDGEYCIKFLRRRGFSKKFYFPQIDDIETCEQSAIYAKLSKYSVSRRDSCVTFFYNFEGITVK